MTQPAANPVCPTCEKRATSDIDSGAATRIGAAASYRSCPGEQVSLTPAAAQSFKLEQLRAFLQAWNTVEGLLREGSETTPTLQGTTGLELRFNLGEVSYYRVSDDHNDCHDTIWANTRVQGRVGDGLLIFEGDGILWQRSNEPSAHFYARADLATATGTYEPEFDTSMPHVGAIEISLYAAPGHLRGDVSPAVLYFKDDADLRRYFTGSWWPAAYQALFQFEFPSDSCEDGELPFAHGEGIELLQGQSAVELRARATDLIAETLTVDAVWSNNSTTRVEIDLGALTDGTVCIDSGRPVTQAGLRSDWVLRIPIAGRLRSGDARLDIPLDELLVGVTGDSISGVSLHSWVATSRLNDAQKEALGSNVDVLNGWVTYTFDPAPTHLDGIVDFLEDRRPTSGYTRTECLAFPPGGERDAECR